MHVGEETHQERKKMGSKCKITIFLTLLITIIPLVASMEFLVGDDKGWSIPKKHDQMYRFKVNDTVRFKYKKDSVLVVTELEYEKCRSAHPYFFSNNGDSVFTLDRSGMFYFISGVAGHCERGQRMIIKVLEIEAPPGDQSGKDETKSGAAALEMSIITTTSSIIILLLTMWSLFV